MCCFSLRLTDPLLLSQLPLMPPTEALLTASVLDGENLNKEPNTVSDSAVVSSPPPLTPPAEAPLTDSENLKDKPTREPESAVVSTLPPLMPPVKAPVASVLDGESLKEGPDREPDSAVVSAQLAPLSPLDEACVMTQPSAKVSPKGRRWYQMLLQLDKKNSATAA